MSYLVMVHPNVYGADSEDGVLTVEIGLWLHCDTCEETVECVGTPTSLRLDEIHLAIEEHEPVCVPA